MKPNLAAIAGKEPFLTAQEYDRRESAARLTASYPALRSFAPTSFAHVGFPMRVSSEPELRNFVDIMHELDDRQLWIRDKTWSLVERNLISQLRSEILKLTGELFQKPVDPLMNLFLPMPVMRMVEHISKTAAGGRKLKVLEIGPGSAFQSAYLLLRGHSVMGYDVTQSLYLWQHRLFRWLSHGDFTDFALADAPPTRMPSTRASLLPWWFYAQMYTTAPIDVDVVICDAAMGEMDPFAARYVIRLAKTWLERSDVGVFMYKNLGEPRQNTFGTIDDIFNRVNGYRPHACGPVFVQCANHALPTSVFDNLENGPPPIEAAPGEVLGNADGLVEEYSKDRLEAYDFFEYLRLFD